MPCFISKLFHRKTTMPDDRELHVRVPAPEHMYTNPILGQSNVSDGSTASYYELPEGASELQDLISYKDMNSQIGEIFRACYRYGQAAHSNKLRDAKKIKFYIDAEIRRLEASS